MEGRMREPKTIRNRKPRRKEFCIECGARIQKLANPIVDKKSQKFVLKELCSKNPKHKVR